MIDFNAKRPSMAERDRTLRSSLGSISGRSLDSKKFDALSPAVRAHLRSNVSMVECQIVDAVYRGVEQSRGQPVVLAASDVSKAMRLTQVQAEAVIRGLVTKGYLVAVTSPNTAQLRYKTSLQVDAAPGLASALGVKKAVPAVPAFVDAAPSGALAGVAPVGSPAQTSGNVLIDMVAALARAVEALTLQIADAGATQAQSGPGKETKSTKSDTARITSIAGTPVEEIGGRLPVARMAGDLAPRVRKRAVDLTRKS
jgi:hypothetical protein